MTKEEIKVGGDSIVGHLRDAQKGIQEMFGAGTGPAATRAAYEAATKLDEAYMWLSNGLAFLMQHSDEAVEEVVAQSAASGELKIIEGGKKA